MSETPDPKPSVAIEHKSSEWRSPQVILPIIATVSTILVAVIGVIPSIMEANKPPAATPTPLVILIATPIPATSIPPTAVPATNVPVEVAAVSTLAPTDAPAAASIATTAPTEMPATSVPTIAPTDIPPTEIIVEAAPTAVPNVTLFYDQDSFTIYNMTGARISLEGITFKGPEVSWDISPFGGSMKSLPSSKCLRLRDATVGNRRPPAECGSSNYAFLEIGPRVIFWRGEYFDVVRDGAVLATCQTAAGKCEIYVAQ